MIQKIKDYIQYHKFFFTISIITTVCVIAVTLFVSYFVIQMSVDVYLEAYSDSNKKIIYQIRDDYYELHSDVVNVLSNCQNNQALYQYFTNNDLTSAQESHYIYTMASQLEQYGVLHNNISSNLLLVGFNQKKYCPNSLGGIDDYQEIMQSEVVKKALENPREIIYQYAQDGFGQNLKKHDVIIAIKVLRNVDTKQNYGLAIVMLDQRDFASYYTNLIDEHINEIYIVDEQQKIISSNHANYIGKIDQSLQAVFKKKEDSSQKVNGRKYSVSYTNMPFMDSQFVSMIDETGLIEQINFIPSVFMIGLVVLMIAITITLILFRKSFEPLNVMMKQIPAITQGDFEHHVEVSGSGEIQELSRAFNTMMDGLKEYVDRVVKLQEEKRLVEIRALQMQINPHFVYNTLTSIKFLIWQKNNQLAIEAIEAFIQLLRNTLSHHDEYVMIDEEIENLKNYVKIQNIRYNNKIIATYDIDQSCHDLMILKMLLQPFIENAIFHAFNEQEVGTIKVFVKVIKNQLTIEIIDNGIGMSEDEVNQLLSGEADQHKNFSEIGVNNVNKRIKLLYGEGFGVKINSIVSQGTIVSIVLPVLVKEDVMVEKL